MQVYSERPKRFERNVSKFVQGLRQEIFREDGECRFQISHLLGNGFLYPVFVQLFVDVVEINLSLKELSQRIH